MHISRVSQIDVNLTKLERSKTDQNSIKIDYRSDIYIYICFDAPSKPFGFAFLGLGKNWYTECIQYIHLGLDKVDKSQKACNL